MLEKGLEKLLRLGFFYISSIKSSLLIPPIQSFCHCITTAPYRSMGKILIYFNCVPHNIDWVNFGIFAISMERLSHTNQQ